MFSHDKTVKGNKVIVHAVCSFAKGKDAECKFKKDIEFVKQDYIAWRNGVSIQNVRPDLDADDRELLISGTCGKCFDEMMGAIEENNSTPGTGTNEEQPDDKTRES